MGGQLLGSSVFKHRTKVDVFLTIQQRQLDSVCVGGRQQVDVAEEQLEQIALLVQPQRQRRFFHVVGRHHHTRIGQPQKTVVVTAQLEILVQVF